MAEAQVTGWQRWDPGEREQSILAAAALAFARQPYSEVKISAIAKAAGVSDALIYRYFDGKEALYAAVVQLTARELAARQQAALAALPGNTARREKVRVVTEVYLDHIAADPAAWAIPLRNPGAEPASVTEIREQSRAEYVATLGAILHRSAEPRHEYALWGYFGFLDAACLHWVDVGFPADGRWPLLEAALGALEGALGDWSA
ncbi:MAG: TetR/AcrR family transcriptional regulator [Promicromonosporaceae bacterium]|nr:TetR/AcrR family transcriptional regulator [Promicromonosporaceae bacterium]